MEGNKQTLGTLSIDADVLNSIEAETYAEKVYQAAKIYARAGLLVVPLRENSKFLPESHTGINYGTASNKLATMERWFNPINGKFAGQNIGLATGKLGGIFVVDVDEHGEVNGKITLATISEGEEGLDGPMQTTPNNGEHYVYQWEEYAKSSTGKIGAGIDTRGGEENACKGHIVVFPSVIGSRSYKWAVGGLIPFVPDWIMNKMGRGWSPKKGYGRGNEEVGTDDVEDTLEIEQIERMLDAIDPNELSYEQWLRIGQSINSQYHTDEGLAIWDNWSSRGKRYQNNECRSRWRGFDPSGAVRSGTLFYFAQKYGWKPVEKDKTGKRSQVLQIIERLNEDYAIVLIGGKIKILQENRHPALLTDNRYNLLDLRAFQTYMLNDSVELGGDKPIEVSKLWLGHNARREYPNGLVLGPNGEVPAGAYNTWAGYQVSSIEGPCNLFLTHLKEVICGGDIDNYEWLLDWCADLFQSPADPKGCCIVMRGGEGTGKGTFANTIGEMFGPHYRHLIDDSHLLSNFNAHMIDALFVFADEITWGGNKKTAGKLKGMVTEKYLVGERKGIDAVGYRNMIHMAIASNSEWVIPAGANSRRWFVLDVLDTHARNTTYFKYLYDELSNGGKEALLHFFLNRAIKSDLTQAPETEALAEQRELAVDSSDTVINWWTGIVMSENFPIPDVKAEPNLDDNPWPFQVLKEELHSHYERWCLDRNKMPCHLVVFCTRLTKVGFDMKIRTTVNGKKIRVANVPNLVMAKHNLSEKYNVRFDDDEKS